MKFSKLYFLSAVPLLLMGCSSNIISSSSESSFFSSSQTSTSQSKVIPNPRNKEAFRISEIYDNFGSDSKAIYKVYAPYKDNYTLKCESANKINLYDENGELKESSVTSLSFEAEKDELFYLELIGTDGKFFTLKTTLKDHEIELPYQPNFTDNTDDIDLVGDKTVDPLAPCDLKVSKRKDNRGLYVNCNNPEILFESALNKVLCGQNVTDKDVFFTFEHNNQTKSNFYYGYRVTNEGNEDAFITVKNLGLQIGGPGSWLGEDEWVKFYNLSFKCDKSKYTNRQLNNYNAYVGFINNYLVNPNIPITYRIPAGKYIYVMGGTRNDAYQKINVFGSANKRVIPKDTGCSNGAVLFSTYGSQCYGQFMVYTDDDASTINESTYVKNKKEMGYSTVVKDNDGNDRNVGAQYCGYDNCHGVVDTEVKWTVNDLTKPGSLPVNYKNELFTSAVSGEPFTRINDFNTVEFKNSASWLTHGNPNTNRQAIGNDMTLYKVTSASTGKPIVISPENYDGRGQSANIGNWMVDYLDHVSLVNQGDKARTFTYKMKHNGVILAFVRDENGNVKNDYPLRYQVSIADSEYGDAIRDYFSYSFVVPPHSTTRFVVDYNLLANSYGNIIHEVTLDE